MSVNEKMTALADAVRAKSGADGKLSIDGMAAAVNSIPVGSGIDTSDATATAEWLLSPYTAYVKGQKITGTMRNYHDFQKELTPFDLAVSSNDGFYSAVNVHVDPDAPITFTPSEEKQEYDGFFTKKFLTKVTVNPIPSMYVKTYDATASASDIATGKTAYVKGELITGTGVDPIFYECIESKLVSPLGAKTDTSDWYTLDASSGKANYAFNANTMYYWVADSTDVYPKLSIEFKERTRVDRFRIVFKDPISIFQSNKSIKLFGGEGSGSALIAEVDLEDHPSDEFGFIKEVNVEVPSIYVKYKKYIAEFHFTYGVPGVSAFMLFSDESHFWSGRNVNGGGIVDHLVFDENVPEVGRKYTQDGVWEVSDVPLGNGATAAASDISAGVTAYVKGELVTGTMEDVAAVIDGSTVTIPAGRIRNEQTLTVQSGSVSVDGGTVNISAGYIEAGTLSVEPSSGLNVSGAKVTVGKGYIAEDSEITIPSGSVSIDGNKVTVSEGYVTNDNQTIPAGNVYVRGTVVAVEEGYVVSGTLPLPTGSVNIEGNEVKISAGFVGDDTRTIPAGSVSISEDKITVSEGYVTNDNQTIPAGSVSIDGNKVTVVKGYVKNNTLTVPAGSVVIKGNKVVVSGGYVTTQEIPTPGNASFYLCAEVFGPEKVSGYVVSGAGTAEVNGNYIPTDLTTEEGSPVYKHETAEYYYYEMWGEKGITTSPEQYPSEGLYYNMYDEGWTVGTGEADPPEVTQKDDIIINADTPKTWNGYHAILGSDGGYTLSGTLTENLSYNSGFKPVVGGIYDGLAKVKVSNLFETVKPITTNDTACLIYIDGTSLTNKALAPNKHDVTFGSGVTAQDGYLNITNDESGQILTTAKTDGYGGNLKAWTWDYFFVSDASYLDCSGHSSYGWTVEGTPGNSLFFRGQNADGKKLGVTFTQNELVGLSIQYDNGVLHVWNKGIYVGTCTPTFPNCDGTPFGIGCIADGDFDRMADKIKLFRFSNKARYTPGVDFELPEGFI